MAVRFCAVVASPAILASPAPYAKLNCFNPYLRTDMLFSKEYVGYLARQITKRLVDGKFIGVKEVPPVVEMVNNAMTEELSLEDRINEDVRKILEAYSEEMRRSGANYQEMFKKIKNELVRKYKAVL
jgi:hypothetical protein